MNNDEINTNTILDVQNLTKTYTKAESTIEVFSGVNFSLNKGMRAVVSGESGSGKTSFLSMVSGLDSIEKGSVKFFLEHGVFDMAKSTEHEKAKFRLYHLGFVFQHHYLLQDFTALGNVELPLLMIQKKTLQKKSEIKNTAMAMLEKVGLVNRAQHKPAELSGGECQRVAVARALVHTPTLVLADEPTGSLDEKNSEKARELLYNLVEEMGLTLLVATHDKNFLSTTTQHWHLKDKKLHRD